MPKIKSPYTSKVNAVVHKYNSEFKSTPTGELYCRLCDYTVKCEKQFMVESHRKSEKHQRGLARTATNFAENVTRAFLCADIPLHKLTNSHIKTLFHDLGHPLPSETACPSKVQKLADQEIQQLKNYLKDEDVFMVVDESEIDQRKFLNILVGKMTVPETTYIFTCKTLSKYADSDIVTREIDDAVHCLGIARHHFCLLMTDAATYMTAAGNLLKKLYPKLFHVICLAHLLHNCAMKVRACFPAVDDLIARVKALAVKNKARRALFSSIGQPPQPVVTRWASWWQAAFYYTKNLPEVRRIVEHLGDGGILLQQAKEALKSQTLSAQLLQIEEQYSDLANIVLKMESSRYTMGQAYEDVLSLDLGADSCAIKAYMQRKLTKNDVTCIMSMGRNDISPHLYKLLQNSQATSASVERSFSILKKILAEDRNFGEGHEKHYLIVKYNNANKAQ
ncbi:unnamed protein product [Clavelina lepadiformis]|uniref:DUF659 domain-containing protein n=1 Tax=Clavelina lepadiformis TaxID=159417 RepID=A0ABP0G9D6_CLALP